jgi:hypothetical protein
VYQGVEEADARGQVATSRPEAQAVTPPRLGTAQVDDEKGYLIDGRVVVMTIPEINAQLRDEGGAMLRIKLLISA